MGIFTDGRVVAWARRHQRRRAQQESRLVKTAVEQDEARAHERRAEKASYLEEKLAEQERSQRGSGEPQA